MQTPADLVHAVTQYAHDLGFEDPTHLLLTPLPFADVRIVFSHSERQGADDWRDVEHEVRIVGVGGVLTGADLLWELHLHCQRTVGASDHHFFEGLELTADGNGKVPTYALILGS